MLPMYLLLRGRFPYVLGYLTENWHWMNQKRTWKCLIKIIFSLKQTLLIKCDVSEHFPSSTLDLICTSCVGVSAGLWPLADTSSCLWKLTCSMVPTRKMNNEWISCLAFKLCAALVSICQIVSPLLSADKKNVARVPLNLFSVFYLNLFGISKRVTQVFFIYLYIYINIFDFFISSLPDTREQNLL